MRLPSLSRRAFCAGLLSVPIARLPHSIGAAQDGSFPLVVDLDWLKGAANSRGLRLFDVSPLHIWRRGHIDSAAHAWWRDTVDPNYPVFGAVLTQGDDESHRQRVIDSLDLHISDRVVVYDNANGFRAARLVWFLRFLGIPNAAVLNADVAEWKKRPFSIGSAPSEGKRPIVDPQTGYYLVTQQVLDRLDTPDLQLIDIRTDAERADDLDGQMPNGQIPGSFRLPWDTLLDGAGRLLTPAALSDLIVRADLDSGHPTVLYGSFGVDTALPWIALTEAGFTNLQTYDRGWAEWSTTPDLPREPLA